MKHIAIIGFGNVGKNLAQLFTAAGCQVTICLREGTSNEIGYPTATMEEGVTAADIIALALPYTAVQEALTPLKLQLKNKILIDCTNPLNEDWSPLLLESQTSAAEQIAAWFPLAKVVKAFNTIFADVMAPEYHNRGGLNITAFVASDDLKAKQEVLTLSAKMGFAPLDVGDLSSARYLEAMAHLNIRIAAELGGGTQAAFIYHQSK